MRIVSSMMCGVVMMMGCQPDIVSGVELLTPAEGLSYEINPFEVPPGEEVQDCYFLTFPDLNGDGSDVWVDRFKMGQTTGSHHLNIFRVKTILHLDGGDGDIVRGGECRISVNWADWPLVVNSQESSPDSPIVDWQLPNNVAQRFSPGELLMVQTHYVNADLQPTPGDAHARINFYRSKVAAPIEMGTLFATQQSIRVCQSRPTPEYSGACAFPGDQEIHIAAVNGHFHGRGKTFNVWAWDGINDQTPPDDMHVYLSEHWDEPPMTIGIDEVIPSGGGIWWECAYQWQEPPAGCDAVNAADPQQGGDCCYVFGNNASNAEHCNVFAYYWPKVDNTDIFCN
jgi:hypothetical protein